MLSTGIREGYRGWDRLGLSMPPVGEPKPERYGGDDDGDDDEIGSNVPTFTRRRRVRGEGWCSKLSETEERRQRKCIEV